MMTNVDDIQTVPETGPITGQTELFRMLQAPPTNAAIILKNLGANQINYKFQYTADGVTWVDAALAGTDLNNTLASGSTGIRTIVVSSAYGQLRCIGNSTGASSLNFSIIRHYARPDGGAVPLLSY